jgi:hypothetical protein
MNGNRGNTETSIRRALWINAATELKKKILLAIQFETRKTGKLAPRRFEKFVKK